MQNHSLNGLRMFEAGARHLSFTFAASELNVTQAAVSQQIRQQIEILLPLKQRWDSPHRSVASEHRDVILRTNHTTGVHAVERSYSAPRWALCIRRR